MPLKRDQRTVLCSLEQHANTHIRMGIPVYSSTNVHKNIHTPFAYRQLNSMHSSVSYSSCCCLSAMINRVYYRHAETKNELRRKQTDPENTLQQQLQYEVLLHSVLSKSHTSVVIVPMKNLSVPTYRAAGIWMSHSVPWNDRSLHTKERRRNTHQIVKLDVLLHTKSRINRIIFALFNTENEIESVCCLIKWN